jgi:hypothetical protein
MEAVTDGFGSGLSGIWSRLGDWAIGVTIRTLADETNFSSNAMATAIFGWLFGVVRAQLSTARATDADLLRLRSAPP